jgi:hypothetical protein
MTTCFNPLCSEWYLFCPVFILRLHDFSTFLDHYILYLISGAYTSAVLRLCCLRLISLACKRRLALIIFITAPILTYTINNINSLDKHAVYSILLFSFFSATQNVLNIAFVKMQICNKVRINSQHFCHGAYT